MKFYKITATILTVGIVLVGINNNKLNNTIQTNNENIKIIENENSKLYEELLENNQQIREYKNKLIKLEQENAELSSYKYYKNVPLDNSTQRLIQDLCDYYNLEYEIALSVFKVESDFNPGVLSATMDSGIGQISLRYIHFYASTAGLENYDPYDLEDGIRMSLAGLNYYQNLLIEKGYKGKELTVMMLGIYNRGENGMYEYIQNNGTIHTEYSDKVLQHRNKLLNI